MSLLVSVPGANTEAIQRGALLLLHRDLNTVLGNVEAVWNSADEDFAARMDRPFQPTVLERVASQDFHEGFRPSLIKAPIDRYPNVAVMAYSATPGAGSELYDHQEKYRVTVVVETMVRASPEEGEEVCNRRAHRMVEAVNLVLSSDPTFGGIVSGFDSTPTTRVTELFTRKSDKNARSGPEWFWQGGRLEYTVRKEAALPSTHGTNFRAPTYEGLDIDQPVGP